MDAAQLIRDDAFDMLCGKQIGHGSARRVFVCQYDPALVVKVETDDWSKFQNVLEMTFWQDNRDYEAVAKWLAPCVSISPNGRILIQRRATPVPSDFKWPKRLPGFITDTKRSNFGIYEGRLVSVDYALTIPNPSIVNRKAQIWT